MAAWGFWTSKRANNSPKWGLGIDIVQVSGVAQNKRQGQSKYWDQGHNTVLFKVKVKVNIKFNIKAEVQL